MRIWMRIRLHCPLSAAVGHLKQLEEEEEKPEELARLTFAPAQAALLAKSQIAAQQNGDCVRGEGAGQNGGCTRGGGGRRQNGALYALPHELFTWTAALHCV